MDADHSGGVVEGIPHVSWAEHLDQLRWRQGEHVALVGPTGQGKTTLALQLIQRRDWRVILATKPRDRTLAGLTRDGYKVIRKWPPPHRPTRRVILWPQWRTQADTRRQAGVIHDAITSIFREGSWCVFADDVQYLTRQLGLSQDLQLLWLQARALNVSLVAATQRPRWVPMEMWSQSSHIYMWRTNDGDDLRRIASLGAHDSKTIRQAVANLPPYHVLYVDTRNGGALHTTVVETLA